MTGKLGAGICCLLVTVGAVTAQTAQTPMERLLPQWLTGVIAISAFLFLIFVSLLVKKAWFDEKSSTTSQEAEPVRGNDITVITENTYQTSLDLVRSKEEMNTYENPAIDVTGDKVTSM